MTFNVTFGICSDGSGQYLDQVIKSIEDNYPPLMPDERPIGEYEILVATPDIPGGWLPKKKNWIAQNAQYDNLVLLHDYMAIDRYWIDWTNAYTNVAPRWDILINQVSTLEGTRSADWLINPNHIDAAIRIYPELEKILLAANPKENRARYISALPYDEQGLEKIQYISGGYIVCKKQLLLDHPMNEDLSPGSSEDVEWSERVLAAGAKLAFNMFPVTRILKPNKWTVTEMPEKAISIMKEYVNGL